MNKALFFVLALGAAGAVEAQQPRRITFNDAVAIALEQNLALKQAKNGFLWRLICARYSSETSIGAVILR
jgi:hypothetical protein